MGTIAVSAREAQEARALTAGMITCVDDAIGRVLASLDRSGQRENTVVMFTSDHGDHLGDHRLMLKGAEHYQSIVHVPFIWSDPESRQPARTDALGATADISATILERAGLAPYLGLQGKSLLPAMGSGGRPVRDAVLIQYEQQTPDADFSSALRVYSLIHQDMRLSVFYDRPWGELYDLRNDPGEFENLWDSPPHAALRARMMERLAYACIEHTDRVPKATGRA
jgi:arylsulfatase A-like enzyme